MKNVIFWNYLKYSLLKAPPNNNMRNEDSNLDLVVYQDLRNQIKDHARWRGYINIGCVCAYVRQTIRRYNAKDVNTLEIGNVTVEEEKQRQGEFSRFLEAFIELAKERKRAVLVECVHNPHLAKYLLRKGFDAIDGPSYIYCTSNN